MTVTKDIRYIGVNDHEIDLFEGQYVVPNGMSYNSYAILDEKTAIMDTVDKNFTHQWMDNIEKALEGRKPDYLVVHHMEPDHSANIDKFLALYPEAVVVASSKAFAMMLPEPTFTPLPKYPAVTRDLSLLCDETVTIAELEKVITAAGGKLLRRVDLFDIYRGKGVAEGKKSVAFSLVLRADDRTLTDADSEGVVSKVLAALETKLGAVLR